MRYSSVTNRNSRRIFAGKRPFWQKGIIFKEIKYRTNFTTCIKETILSGQKAEKIDII